MANKFSCVFVIGHAHLGLIRDDHASDLSGMRGLRFSFFRSDLSTKVGDDKRLNAVGRQ